MRELPWFLQENVLIQRPVKAYLTLNWYTQGNWSSLLSKYHVGLKQTVALKCNQVRNILDEIEATKRKSYFFFFFFFKRFLIHQNKKAVLVLKMYDIF